MKVVIMIIVNNNNLDTYHDVNIINTNIKTYEQSYY